MLITLDVGTYNAVLIALKKYFQISLVLAAVMAASAQEAFMATSNSIPQAPPPAPPMVHRFLPEVLGTPLPLQGPTLYSIGQPTDEEQLYLEYLNRMRANPTAEGQRLAATTDSDVLSSYSYFGVDLALMQSQFSAYSPVPPLAMNAQLEDAARWHSGDMYTNQYQGHSQTNGTTVMAPWDRMVAKGYSYTSAAENVFSYAKSVFSGHAGFAVDWGNGTGGMQTPAGHRENMLNGSLREVGMGVVDGTHGTVGPQLVTQDFGTASTTKPFLTGVVYYDLNGNGFYDVGEGIGGVTVNLPGSSYYAVTADSGGYTIPLTTNGNYVVNFSAAALSTQLVATITGSKNIKVDFIPSYQPPIISGPDLSYASQSNTYTFTAVGAATGYQWQQSLLAAYSAVEGAENGLTNVTVVQQDRIEECCGFGGTFSVRHPDISAAIVTDKVEALRQTGTKQVVSADCGCLFNIVGRSDKMDQLDHQDSPSLTGEHMASFLWRRTSGEPS